MWLVVQSDLHSDGGKLNVYQSPSVKEIPTDTHFATVSFNMWRLSTGEREKKKIVALNWCRLSICFPCGWSVQYSSKSRWAGKLVRKIQSPARSVTKAQQQSMYKQAVLGLWEKGEHRSFLVTASRAEILDNQELPSPFFVLSTTRLTMTGIKQIGVITRAKMTAGGGSLKSSVGHSLKNLVWISTKVCSTKGFGHGIKRQSDTSSVQRLKLLYILGTGREY